MARLLRGAPVDWVGEWSRALWRAAAGCIAVVLLTAAFSAWNAQRKPGDFSREFEIAVFASPGALDDIQ